MSWHCHHIAGRPPPYSPPLLFYAVRPPDAAIMLNITTNDNVLQEPNGCRQCGVGNAGVGVGVGCGGWGVMERQAVGAGNGMSSR